MRQSAEAFHPFIPSRSAVCLLLGAVALVLAAGCAGPRPPEHGHSEPPQPSLATQGVFFTDAITVDARITAFHRSLPRPDRAGETRDNHPERMRGPGGGPPGGGFSHSDSGPRMHGSGAEGGRPPRGGFAPWPRQTLHIVLTNRSGSPLTIAIAALNSALGNFAPQPDHLTLAPGASATLDPMSSDAGGLLQWLDVTLTLRSGGETETRVLHLVATGETAPPLPPPPAR